MRTWERSAPGIAAPPRESEQGFTVAKRPGGGGALRIAMRATGDLVPSLAGPTSLSLADPTGHPSSLGYGGTQGHRRPGRSRPGPLQPARQAGRDRPRRRRCRLSADGRSDGDEHRPRRHRTVRRRDHPQRLLRLRDQHRSEHGQRDRHRLQHRRQYDHRRRQPIRRRDHPQRLLRLRVQLRLEIGQRHRHRLQHGRQNRHHRQRPGRRRDHPDGSYAYVSNYEWARSA